MQMKRSVLAAAFVVITAPVLLTACAGRISPVTVPASVDVNVNANANANGSSATETQPNSPPPGAEISDDPLVRALVALIDSPSAQDDAATSLRINALRGDGDRIMAQCTGWLHKPDTIARVRSLGGLQGVLRVVPIRPVGPLSTLAEVRRVEYDVTSGELAARLAAKRAELRELQTDATLNCAALLVDTRLFGLRFAAALAARTAAGGLLR